MKRVFLAIAAVIFSSLISLSLTKEEALENMINNYPRLQLADVYKSFFQDNFGPGHLLSDSISALKYFMSELQDTSIWGGPQFEFTGEGKNFVRLNMDLIRKGIIPANEYFKAFQNSLGSVNAPSSEYWIAEWNEIDSLINVKNYHFINEDIDRELIKNKLNSGNFPVHHSDNFNETYNFHYRIISLPEFSRLMRIYMPESQVF